MRIRRVADLYMPDNVNAAASGSRKEHEDDDLLSGAMALLGDDRPEDFVFRACPECGFFLGAKDDRVCPEHGQAVALTELSQAVRQKATLSVISQVLKVLATKRRGLKKADRAAKQQAKMLRTQTRPGGFRSPLPPNFKLKPVLAQLSDLERQCRILQAQALSQITGEVAPPKE